MAQVVDLQIFRQQIKDPEHLQPMKEAVEFLSESIADGSVHGFLILPLADDGLFSPAMAGDIPDNSLLQMIGALELMKKELMEYAFGE